MNDIRFRTVTGVCLSFTAFFSLMGALFTIVWWPPVNPSTVLTDPRQRLASQCLKKY